MAVFHDPSAPGDLPLRIDIADAHRSPIRVATTAIPTLLAIADGVCGRRGRPLSPTEVRARAALDARDLWALAPVVLRPGGLVPDCVVPLPSSGGHAVPADELERLADVPPERLLVELGDARDTRAWSDAVRAPARWIEAYGRALERIWSETSLHWRAAAAVIDRESERIGVAIARGCVPAALRLVHDTGTVSRGVWRLPGVPHELRIGDAGLILAPRLAHTRASLITAATDRELTHLSYSVAPQPRPAPAALDPSTLDALLGQQRAVILRELERPQTAGRIAEALHAVPSVASHHVGALEAAGLVSRERQGRHVVVSRTSRGTAVLSLYE